MISMEELAQKARGGDAVAEKQLFEKLSERFRYLAKLKIGEEHCEDLAQEACMTVFEKYKEETFKVGFLPWAHGVLKMKIGNYLQKKGRKADREQDMGEDADIGTSRPANPDVKRFLLECLRELIKAGGHYARILNLSYQGYGTDDVCERLGIVPNNYYVALSRGRTMLRRCLESKGVTA
jgi:RNA polymerase sigma factor (sigma-70 family)